MRRLLILFICVAASAAADETNLHIRINQVGYLPHEIKSAIAFSDIPLPPEFELVHEGDQIVVHRGKSQPANGSWGNFPHHATLDFSAFRTPGRYFLRIGEKTSRSFPIREEIYDALPSQLLEFMRQQRCGYNPWLDAVCHRYDGRTAFGVRPAGSYLDASGGWHDAGDLLKYLITSSNATAQMLLAFELASQGRRAVAIRVDAFNALGQPGANGLPDVLDEAKWGLDWMLKLHPSTNELYHQVADDRDHIAFRDPATDPADYGWGKGTYRPVYFADGQPQGLGKYKSESDGVANVAGRYAAAMALGASIFRRFPAYEVYATQLLRAGREVYELGRRDEGVQQGNSFSAPYRYEETTWADDMEWGAAELYRVTKESRFLRDSKRYAALASTESVVGRTEARHYQYYPFMNIGHYRLFEVADRRTRADLVRYYREGIERAKRNAAENPYGIGAPFIWCSNNLMVALATQALLLGEMTGQKEPVQFAALQRDWLLGRNPWDTTMFTGIPEEGDSPSDVHLMTVAVFKKPVRGGLVDGPVARKIFTSLKGVYITEPDPLAEFQDERAVYHDVMSDYSTNEPTMDGTASAILLWALYLD